ncbi:MAG TPA: hypothetical protein DG753_03890 [Clostridium sp.]|nr:hypothetical protein [Clostridium sp.]
MNRDFKRLIYIIIGVGIFVVVAKLFIKLLPWLIVIGGIAYVVSKIKSSREQKKLKNNTYDKSSYKNNINVNIYETNPEDYTNGEVIDVDYEDVDNK